MVARDEIRKVDSRQESGVNDGRRLAERGLDVRLLVVVDALEHHFNQRDRVLNGRLIDADRLSN